MVDTIYSHDNNFSLAAQYTFIEYTAANVLHFCEIALFFPLFFSIHHYFYRVGEWGRRGDPHRCDGDDGGRDVCKSVKFIVKR